MTKRGVRRWVTPFIVAASALSMGGCAAPVIGAITLSQLTTAAGIASSIMSGRDLTEHVVSAVVGEDCRFLEAIMRGRPICVPYGSTEAEESFQGIIVALRGDDEPAAGEAKPIQVAGLDEDAIALGFVPIAPDIATASAAIDAVERDITDTSRGDMRRVSFGMMSATYGPSHSMDDLLAQQRAKERGNFAQPAGERQASRTGEARVILASAAPTPLPAQRADGKMIVPDMPQMRGTTGDTPEDIAARAVMAPIADDHLSE